METSQQNTVTKYLGDLLAATRHVKEAFQNQLEASFMTGDAGAREAVSAAHDVLSSQIVDLEHRLVELDAGGTWKQTVTTITGVLAGLYDRLRSEQLARALRDNYTALCFVHICQTMMLTTAAGCGDTGTAELVRQHQRHLPPLIMKMAERVPAAVVHSLESDQVPLMNRNVPEISVRALRNSWQHASVATLE